MYKYTKIYILLLLIIFFSKLSFGQIIIEGDGEIVQKGSANIILSNDWTNNANNSGYSASSGLGSVIFKGISAQTSGGSKYSIFSNSTMNNSDGLILGALTMISHLTFIDGIITTTSSNVLYISDGGDIIGAADGKFINGPMAKMGDQDFKFEIGEGIRYAPIKISDLSANKTITAVYHKATPSNKDNLTSPLVKVSDIEYWVLDDPDGGSGFPPSAYSNAKIEIFWEDAALSGIKSVDSDTLKFARLNGTNWDPESAIITGAAGNASGSIGTTSNFDLNSVNVTFGSTNKYADPLPISLLSFTADCNNDNNIEINWTTATEQNNDYFTLLRSYDGIEYEEIDRIMGAGNSNDILNYTYSDYNTAEENYYYKLQQTDYDGKSVIFDAIYVKCQEEKVASLQIVYDNNKVYSYLSGVESGNIYTILVLDNTGRIVVQESITVNSHNYYSIPTQQLSSGIYSIVYYGNNTIRLNKKFLVR